MEESKDIWNKKRIFIVFFLVMLFLIGGFFFKIRILDGISESEVKSVKGTSTKKTGEDFGIDIQEAIREKIKNLQQDVSGLNITEIASTSPQVQKILNDIKNLEKYPGNQAKEICKKICGL